MLAAAQAMVPAPLAEAQAVAPVVVLAEASAAVPVVALAEGSPVAEHNTTTLQRQERQEPQERVPRLREGRPQIRRHLPATSPLGSLPCDPSR